MTPTKSDIPQFLSYGEAARVELPCGWHATVRIEPDEDHEAPWDAEDGHGPVSGWRKMDSKRAGERVLHADGTRARFYDFAEAVRIARKDGWGVVRCRECGEESGGIGTSMYGSVHKFGPVAHGAFAPESHGETAARAAQQDFEFLRAWCNDEWQYIGVIVTVYDADGSKVADDALWGVESLGDYWREVAAENINGIVEGVIVPNSAAV